MKRYNQRKLHQACLITKKLNERGADVFVSHKMFAPMHLEGM